MAGNQEILARHGLSLPRGALRRLDRAGIFVQPHVSLEHQHLARRYVVRGIESGGAVEEIGRYVAFCSPTGEQLVQPHPIDSLGVNGIHAIVIAPVLVRIELFRTGRSCQLLVTRHEPDQRTCGRRPLLVSSVVFSGVDGFLPFAGERHPFTPNMPRFWSLSGEGREIPGCFAAAVQAVTRGATCLGCSHAHFSSALTRAMAQA